MGLEASLLGDNRPGSSGSGSPGGSMGGSERVAADCAAADAAANGGAAAAATAGCDATVAAQQRQQARQRRRRRLPRPDDDGGGDDDQRGSVAAVAATSADELKEPDDDEEEEPRMSLLTLRLSPPAAEARFWREAGTPAFAATDRYTLLYTAVVIAASTWHALREHGDGTSGIGPRANAALAAASACIGAAALAARVWLWRDPKGYEAWRPPFAVANRLARSVFMLVVYNLLSHEGWRRLVFKAGVPEGTGAGGADVADAAAQQMLRALALSAMFWAMHALLFPFAFRRAAPLHAAVCAAAAASMRGFACLARADAAAAAGARLLRERLAAAAAAAYVAIGLAPRFALPAGGGAPCGAGGAGRAPEELVALSCALSCALAAFALYEREHALKRRWLAARARARLGRAPEDLSGGRGAAPRGAGALSLALTSYAAARVLAAALPPFDCRGFA